MRVLSMLALLALALLAAPLAAEAQQPGKVYRIGILRDGLAHHPRHRLGPSWRIPFTRNSSRSRTSCERESRNEVS
jgi:hypothetical protein